MTWSARRRVTSEDRASLKKAAESFIAEYPEVTEGFEHGDPVFMVKAAFSYHENYGEHAEEYQAWTALVGEALGEGMEDIAFGYVGAPTERAVFYDTTAEAVEAMRALADDDLSRWHCATPKS